MRKLLIVLILGLLLCTGCQVKKPLSEIVPFGEPNVESQTTPKETLPEKTPENIGPFKLDPSDYPRVDGSTATIPLSLSTFMTLTGADQDEAESTIVHTRTANAYNRLMNGEVDLLIVYEAPDSIKEVLKTSTVKLKIEPVGKDALVFITNEQNPVGSVSQQTIIDIYSGKLTNWKILEGQDLEIIPFQRPADSGSQTLMKNLVMKQVPFVDAPSFLKPEMMGELIDRLAEYDNTANAIGYSVYYYAKNMYEQPGLKFLEVDDVLPSNTSIQDGSYPYVQDFYVVIRENEPETSSTYKVYEWLLSENGQQLVTENGYVSIH